MAPTPSSSRKTPRRRRHITITEAAKPGRHIRPAGVDFREGDVLLAKGRRLTDRDLSLAAGMNYPELAVHRRPEGRGARHRR
jgi:molybdopterin molybdotransferase